MFRKFFWVILIIMLITGVGRAQAAEKNGNKEYIFVIYVHRLQASDFTGPKAPPNMTELKKHGVSYRHVAPLAADPKDSLLGLLGRKNNQLLLPPALAKNDIDSLLVDGSDTVAGEWLQKYGMDFIAEKSDALLMDKFLATYNRKPSRFVLFYLDDTSEAAGEKGAAQQWSVADNQLGRLVNYLIRSGKLQHSTIFLTGGSQDPPLIMYGNNIVAPGTYFYCHQQDIVPTICSLLGIDTPTGLVGNVMYECLPASTLNDYIVNLKKRIVGLQQECLSLYRELAIAEREKQLVDKQKHLVEKERKIFRGTLAQQEKELEQLKKRIKLQKALTVTIVLLMGFGYVVEYKILRKKFLLFP